MTNSTLSNFVNNSEKKTSISYLELTLKLNLTINGKKWDYLINNFIMKRSPLNYVTQNKPKIKPFLPNFMLEFSKYLDFVLFFNATVNTLPSLIVIHADGVKWTSPFSPHICLKLTKQQKI